MCGHCLFQMGGAAGLWGGQLRQRRPGTVFNDVLWTATNISQCGHRTLHLSFKPAISLDATMLLQKQVSESAWPSQPGSAAAGELPQM